MRGDHAASARGVEDHKRRLVRRGWESGLSKEHVREGAHDLIGLAGHLVEL